MKYNDWYWETGKDYTTVTDDVKVQAAMKQLAQLSWQVGSNEGRKNASKGGKLNRFLAKFLSNKRAAKISNAIGGWIF